MCANLYRNTINDGDSQTSSLPIFPEGVGTSVHRLKLSFSTFPARNEGTLMTLGNVSNANRRAMSICTEKFLFLTDHKVS